MPYYVGLTAHKVVILYLHSGPIYYPNIFGPIKPELETTSCYILI